MNAFHKIDGCDWKCDGPGKCEWCRQGDVPTAGRDRSAARIDTLLADAGIPHVEIVGVHQVDGHELPCRGVGCQLCLGGDRPRQRVRNPAAVGRTAVIGGPPAGEAPPAGRPANPFVHPQPYGSMDGTEAEWKVRPGDEGLSLRDLAALHAMQGLVACRAYLVGGKEDQLARQAYKLADAMLTVREGGAS